MRYRNFTLALLFALAAVAAPAATYNGGRCDGFLTVYGGGYIRFTPGNNPAPRFLWLLVTSGGGSAFLQTSGGSVSQSFSFQADDLLVFDAESWIDLYFQASSVQFYYGGAFQNQPDNPVCNTGALGPVLVLTNELRNLGAESGVQGPPDIRAIVYRTTTEESRGTLVYKSLSNAALAGFYASDACSGSNCCSPSEVSFPVKNLSGGVFTGYLLDSENQVNFDWKFLPVTPLACSATATPDSGTAPVQISFSATASGGSAGYSFDWNFGDGKSGTGQSISHTYKSGGTFTWKLKVSDYAGKDCEKTGTIQVVSPLTLSATASPRTGDPPLTVQFQASPQGGREPFTFSWVFGDEGTSTAQNPSHTYATAAKYDWTVTVTDSEDREATAAGKVFCGFPIDPQISAAVKLSSPFRLKVVGADFESGCEVRIGGIPAPETLFKTSEKVLAKGGSALKAMLPKGVPVCVTVRNPSGGESACYTFTR